MGTAKETLRWKLARENTTIDQIISLESLDAKEYLEDEVRKQTKRAAAISGHLTVRTTNREYTKPAYDQS